MPGIEIDKGVAKRQKFLPELGIKPQTLGPRPSMVSTRQLHHPSMVSDDWSLVLWVLNHLPLSLTPG